MFLGPELAAKASPEAQAAAFEFAKMVSLFNQVLTRKS
jgi:hypothetical protein